MTPAPVSPAPVPADQEEALRERYTVVYEGDSTGVKILSGEPATGRAVTVMAGDLWEELTKARNAARYWEWIHGEKDKRLAAAQAKRDQLASELREAREARDKLRSVLKTIAEGEVMTFDEGLGFDVSFWMDEEEMSALARAALSDPRPSPAKGDDHHG